MNSILKYTSILAAIVLFMSPKAVANEYDALDVFEEFAEEKGALECRSFEVRTDKNTAFCSKLEYSVNGDVEIVIVSQPTNGSVEITSADGTFEYTPKKDFEGKDCFSFRVSNVHETSNIAVCSIKVEKARTVMANTMFMYADMSGHWCEYAASKLVECDVIKGERIGSKYYFYPDKFMTRADSVNLILSSLDIDADTAAAANVFADCENVPEQLQTAANIAYMLGITEGVQSNGKLYFNPYEEITRAEFMKMIDRAMSPKTKSDVNVSFADFHAVPDWAVQSVKNVVGYKIAEGYDDNTIRPLDKVTKAQAVSMIYQLKKYTEQTAEAMASYRFKNGIYMTEIV